MTDTRAFGNAISPRGDDLSCATELLMAVFTASEDELDDRLSDVVKRLLKVERGSFYPGVPPGDLPLAESVSFDDSIFGYYAVDAPEAMRPRLVALARMTAIALAQRKREANYQQIINQIYDSVIVMDMAGFITSWNQGAERMFGYRATEVIGRNILFLYADEETDCLIADDFLDHGGREMDVRQRRKSGEIFWVRVSLSQLRDAQEIPFGLIAHLTDISDRIENRRLLQLHAKIYEQSDEAIVITDAEWNVLSVNPAFERIMDEDQSTVVGKPLTAYRNDSILMDFDKVADALATDGCWHEESVGVRHNGETFPARVSATTVASTEGGVHSVIWIFTDITEQRRAEERIRHLAYYDAVTGLPNRALLLELTTQSLAEARRDGGNGAMMLLDLNRFKAINDSLGHDAGNSLLCGVAERFRAVMRDGDVVARIGDDEFVVALFDHTHSANSAIVAQRLLSALDTPFTVQGHELRIGASVGISIYPDDGNDAETLLRHADIALHRAKQLGGSNHHVFFSAEMNQRSLERLQIEAGLRRALQHDELVLHYQPKVSLANGKIIGAEALVRWQHPERGLVPPGDFIPIAEESGLIVDIGNWVLEQTCLQARKWNDAGLPVIRVAANLSARQFGPGLAKSIRDLLIRHNLDASWLELEITESMLMNSAEQVIGMMDVLSELGVSLSLDDFGTGYSSLSYLKRFPIETIKIDRSFIKGTPADSDDCAIAAAIVSMSKQLKLRVIAEGVETQAQAAFVRGLGCDEIQGYLCSPAVPVDQFEAMLRDNVSLL